MLPKARTRQGFLWIDPPELTDSFSFSDRNPSLGISIGIGCLESCEFHRFGWSPKFRFVPSTMFTTPGTQHGADTNRRPAHQPQSEGENAQNQMKGMVDFESHKNVPMPASGTMSLYGRFFRLFPSICIYFSSHFRHPEISRISRQPNKNKRQ